MNASQGAKLVYLPLFGKWIGVAMKAVTSDKQIHVGLSGSSVADLADDSEAIVLFDQPFKNPNRITLHLYRDRKNASLSLPRIAAARMSEKKPFGFSLQDCDKSPDRKQRFLQLAYLAVDLSKYAGFEDLYLKVELPQETGHTKPYYLRITLKERVIREKKGFTVRAVEVTENMVPAHLRSFQLTPETQSAQG